MTSEMAHGEAELPVVEHPLPRIGPREYVIVGVFLTIITAVELWTSYSPLANGAKVPILILLSAIKFGAVVAFFMHLRFDNQALTRFFVFGLALASVLLLALIAIFWNDRTEHRPAPQAFVPKAEAPASAAAAPAVASTVQVSEKEFSITAPADATAGKITFEIKNDGTVAHNLYIVKTDLAPDALPVAGAQLDQSKVDVVGHTSGDIAAGASATLTVTLEPGNYVLLCDVPGHYQLGMHAALVVK
jgi:uncharacterized cupredoxin-like copper-binding protein/heme/copper-type cytochrome/quinol oxidase subunit 4